MGQNWSNGNYLCSIVVTLAQAAPCLADYSDVE